MAKALLTGTGPLSDGVATILGALGWEVRRGPPDALVAPGEHLLVVAVAPDNALAASVQLVETMAAHLPDPARDAGGELRAPGQVVFILDRAAQTPGLADGTAQAALLRWMAGAALSLAPHMRLNALTCSPGVSPADLAPLLGWLTSAHAVTGQVVNLGPEPRLTAPWLETGRRQPAGARL